MRVPERELWQEVLLRAITDARLDPCSWPIPASAYAETAEARAYLTTPSKDLATVCALAGVEVEALLDRMQREVASVAVVQRAERHIPQKRNKTFTHEGKPLAVPEWAEITGLSRGTIYSRLQKGWSISQALTTPRKKH